MISKISNNSNKPAFTSLFFTRELSNGKKFIKELSPEDEVIWLYNFALSTQKKMPKYIDTTKEGINYATKNGDKLLLDKTHGADCFHLISKDGKSKTTAINDHIMDGNDDITESIKIYFDLLGKYFSTNKRL